MKKQCEQCGREFVMKKATSRFCDPKCRGIAERKLIPAGSVFGKLTVIELIDRSPRTVYKCRCECGSITFPTGNNLKTGGSQSCGCVRHINCRRHGKTGTIEFFTYHAAKARCTRPSQISYPNYGGRGIKFLFNSFEQWFAELGERPTPGHTVDRINNDGNYEPGNVRWATRLEQRHNQRRAVAA